MTIRINNIPILMILFVGLVPAIAASSQQCRSLELRATVQDGQIRAELTNVSNQSVKIVGKSITPTPGFGGFYFEVHRAGGKAIRNCAMVDGPVPKAQSLQAEASITYTNSVFSIAHQYCLSRGRYVGRVVYYNAVLPGPKVYSKPVESNAFEFTVEE